MSVKERDSVPYGPLIQRVLIALCPDFFWVFFGSICNFRGSQENLTTVAKSYHSGYVGKHVTICVCVTVSIAISLH